MFDSCAVLSSCRDLTKTVPVSLAWIGMGREQAKMKETRENI